MSLPEEWFDIDMQLGVWVRYQHLGCSEGKDKALGIMRTEQGWVWKCHRCGFAGRKPARNLSPDKMVKWVNSLKNSYDKTQTLDEIELPHDFTHKIPSRGLAWLFSFGITEEEIGKFNFGYSPYLNRLIMPVYHGAELVYWQGRNIGVINKKTAPKYVNVYSKKGDNYFRVDTQKSDSIVLVEDIISAIKVGRVATAQALLYASLPQKTILNLYNKEGFTKVYLWLDPDKWKEMSNTFRRYQSLGFNIRFVLTDKDPKYYEEPEIKEILGCQS